MIQKIHLVCDTGYEHTTPIQAFSTEADAEKFIESCKAFEGELPELPECPYHEDQAHPDYALFHVAFEALEEIMKRHPAGERSWITKGNYVIHEIPFSTNPAEEDRKA